MTALGQGAIPHRAAVARNPWVWFWFERGQRSRRESRPSRQVRTRIGLAYPVASLLAGQNAAVLGDTTSLYGGLGRNGAQDTPTATFTRLGPVGTPYPWSAGRILNLEASAFIANHSAIRSAEVAHALLTAIAIT